MPAGSATDGASSSGNSSCEELFEPLPLLCDPSIEAAADSSLQCSDNGGRGIRNACLRDLQDLLDLNLAGFPVVWPYGYDALSARQALRSHGFAVAEGAYLPCAMGCRSPLELPLAYCITAYVSSVPSQVPTLHPLCL